MTNILRWIFVALTFVILARCAKAVDAEIIACANETIVFPRRNATAGDIELYRNERYRIERCRAIVAGWNSNLPYRPSK